MIQTTLNQSTKQLVNTVPAVVREGGRGKKAQLRLMNCDMCVGETCAGEGIGGMVYSGCSTVTIH